MFEVISKARIVGFADGIVLSLCPTMDLLALSMNKMSIWVFRLNGERIYSINNKCIILHHTWSPDGKYFCVSGVDGLCKLYDTNNGALLREFKFISSIELINWSGNHKLIEDDELFKVDILNHLPSVEEFTNFDGLNFMVVSSEDQLSFIFNSFVKLSFPKSFQVLKYGGSSLFNQFYVVSQNGSLGIVNVTVEQNPNVLKIIKIFCKMKHILHNFQIELQSMVDEIPQFFTILDRYISNFYDNLMTESEKNLDKAHHQVANSFTNILLTNLVPSGLVDYWLNQYGERGWKRLGKLGNGTYDLIRNVAYKKLINYLEKFIVLVDELKSVIKFSELDSERNFGINLESVEKIDTSAKEYFKVLYRLIWDVNEEQKLFNEFLNWSKYLVDLLTKDKNGEELSFPVDTNHTDLIKYFRSNLFSSKLFEYLKLELDSNDLIHNSSASQNVVDISSTLRDLFEEVFLDFEKYFASIIHMSGIVQVDSSINPVSEFKIINDTSFICSVTDTTVQVASFDIKKPQEIIYKVLEFQKIISYKMQNDNLIVLAAAEGEFYLQSYNAFSLLRNNMTPTYSSKAVSQDPRHLLLDDSRNFGCLLDTNKKDYCIFQL
ncbi:hypothetical protein PSN45_004948 [Yamadazyma tenuis]|uniref:uncharacterized protein n=1 Tax=Candida tenuis TaxID=2315449 RepID=UPI00279B4E04|nr:hypothetical protein PSN45_004948 [Yamadazyma tenuis]